MAESKPRYIAVPPIRVGWCVGCVLKRYGSNCIGHIKDLELPFDKCTEFPVGKQAAHRRVFVRNTPRGRAAYIAARLEKANG